jgi:hypothetical protein
MTERVTARRDIQRPLDECIPDTTTGDPPPQLRQAVPDLPGREPAAERVAATSSVVAAGTPTRRGVRLRRVLGAPWRGVRVFRAWCRRPSGQFVLPSALVVVMVGAAVAAGALLVPRPGATDETNLAGGPVAPPGGSGAPTAPPVRPSAGPGDVNAGTGRPADVLRGWGQQMSVRTGIPVVAMQAYGYAELVVTETTPGCRLSWTTLAAIGHAESNHGSTGSAMLQSDGRAWPEIIGLPLDGEDDRKLITDTDGGQLDGDPVYDRAVGPMQFLPQTWNTERVDATGEGVADPHNIHDAALAAANYLCRGGRDLSIAQDWWAAVLAYNEVQEYAQQVFDAANDYGRRSR